MSPATIYAKALYEVHSSKASPAEIEKMEEELQKIQKLIESSPELRAVLQSPVVNSKERVAVMDAISQKAAISPEIGLFLALMARKGRLSHLEEVINEFASLRTQAQGGVVGNLVAADALATEDIEALALAFSKKLGKKVSFRISIDPALLAGVRVSVNGITYDGTLQSQLQRLKQSVLSAGLTA